MKFTTSAAIAVAATGAYAQLSVLQPIFTSIGNAIGDLDTAAKGFNGDVAAVTSKADALISAIKSGNTKAAASSDLSLNDALGLTTPVQDLNSKGETLEKDFKAQIAAVQKAGACDTVRSKLADINTASQALIKTVVSKVPEAAQSVAKTLADQLTTTLSKATDDFSEANCKNSGGSGGSSSAAGTPTGGASQTSAAPTGSAPASSAPATTAAPTGGSGGNGTAPGATSTPVVAGAGVLAPAGALVLAVAAALL